MLYYFIFFILFIIILLYVTKKYLYYKHEYKRIMGLNLELLEVADSCTAYKFICKKKYSIAKEIYLLGIEENNPVCIHGLGEYYKVIEKIII